MHRTAELVGLTRAPDNFLAAIASTAGPPSLQILSDLRVHYWLCISDIQGSLQSGRASAADPTAALQTTRLFATIKAQPSDPRRAATLDLFAIVRTPKGARNASKIRLDNLSKINDDLAAWERHWRPILTGKRSPHVSPAKLNHRNCTLEAQLNGDPLAYTVVQHSAQFVVSLKLPSSSKVSQRAYRLHPAGFHRELSGIHSLDYRTAEVARRRRKRSTDSHIARLGP